MKHKARAIRSCGIVAGRPGIAQPMMIPTKLTRQVRSGPSSLVKWSPVGKTLTGGVQWRLSIVRPGLSAPTISARRAPGKITKTMAAERVRRGAK